MNIISKIVDISKFNYLTDNIEEYLNKQGCTLGDYAERLQKLMNSISYCYIHGVVTDKQREQMYRKFQKQFEKSLCEI